MPAPKIAFSKAQRSPSERQKAKAPGSSYKIPMNKPKPRSPQMEYVEANRQEGDSTLDLVHDFQEICTHERQHKVIAATPEKKFMQCPDCKRIKVVK